MLTRDHAIWAYRLLLEREPESETVIIEKAKSPSIRNLFDEMIGSREFQDKHSGLRATINQWVMVDHSIGFKIWVNLMDLSVSWQIIEIGQNPDPDPNLYPMLPEIRFFNKNVKMGNVALDIGANLGFYSLLFSKLVGKSGKVIGFEPLKFLFDYAKRSTIENDYGQCTIHNVAIAAERSTAQLIYAPGSTNWGGAFLSFDGSGLPDHASDTVPVVPLSDFVSDVSADFIKIDVEGAEYRVFSGALDYLSQAKPIITSEIHKNQLQRVSQATPDDYIKLMKSIGYECRKLNLEGEIGDVLDGSMDFHVENVVFLPTN